MGVVFAVSPRQVDAEQARAMVRALGEPLAEREVPVPLPVEPHVRGETRGWFRHGARVIEAHLDVKRPLTVGVFADQPVAEVNEMALESGIDLVQLSGDESWEECLLVARPVIQAVHVSPLDSPSDPMELVQPGFAIALLLDSAHGPHRGGSGQTFDWDVARDVARQIPLMLAGGLGWLGADPVFALAIAAYILWGAWRIGMTAMNMLMDRELGDEDRRRITAIALAQPGVLGLHDLRTRSSGSQVFIQMHLEMDGGISLHESHVISDRVEARVKEAFPNAEVLIHEDPEGVEEERAVFH